MLNTSVRGHGKWGDFLVALIPLSWCGNILVNSNFILRMIEWQNESSLFTIRVQGKQWYWVYKFDATAAQNIFAAPKNIGHNRWFVLTPTESFCADSYYQALHLGTQLEFKSLYYKYLENDNLTKENLNNNTLQTNNEYLTKFNINKKSYPHCNTFIDLYNSWYFRPFIYKKISIKNKLLGDLNNYKLYNLDVIKYNLDFLSLVKKNITGFTNNYFSHNVSYYDYDQLDDLSNFAANIAQQHNTKPIIFLRGILNKHNYSILQKSNMKVLNYKHLISYKQTIINLNKKIKKLLVTPKNLQKKFTLREIKIFLNYPKLWDAYKNKHMTKESIFKRWQLGKNILSSLKNKYNINTLNFNNFLSFNKQKNKLFLNKLILLNLQFGNNNLLVEKTEDSELLWGFRQKKYKRFKKYFFNQGAVYDSKTLTIKKQPKSVLRQLKGTVTDLDYENDNWKNWPKQGYKEETKINYHNSIKYNKHKNELVPVNLARRLLRVKRTLVLPAHVNITLISNSYDVVHSWFIPGLGLKIDCVPGRSTHHTFYIDNIGFYYGQCAEICGRYHHHMPIRLCALSFEHFLVWWQKKGLKRLHRFNSLKNK